MPTRYTQVQPVVEYAGDADTSLWRYAVGYGGGGLVRFALGAVNSARPESTTMVQARGTSVRISTTASWPAIQAVWDELGGSYSIQSSDLTVDELRQVLEALVVVAP